MNKKQKIVIYTGLLIIIITLILWKTGGGEIFTKTKVWVDKTTELDRMLGIEVGDWQNTFIFGLMPPGFTTTVEMISVATITVITVFVATLLIILFRIKTQKETI